MVLGADVTELGQYAFAGCISLESINLSNVADIGDYAFMESTISEADLSAAVQIGEYAFVDCPNLATVTLNEAGVSVAEGAFAYCAALEQVHNMAGLLDVGSYAFAYTALTQADLSGAVSVGDFAFMKEELTPFKVTLGDVLVSLGDNPFAMCAVEPFFINVTETFNGVDFTVQLYSYSISDTILVIDGSLYCRVPSGLELITFAGTDLADTHVAEGTVRVTSMAFAGSDVQLVTLPYTVKSVGHKAFFGCDKLNMVVFQSFDAPILEEEFDPTYYESFEHIPGTGDFGTYTDYDGTEVQINGIGLNP